ncbi:hypothetical protein RND81_05G198200 [Saponaria officinalis]|uniref:Prolamin-like domain-containing protein n=1 Tax=Saponaria officinalis TaxID=3572 RepID=A0AAW1L0G3_SAPOF
MDTSIKITLLLVTLFFVATKGAANQSNVAQSLSKSNEFQKCENGLGTKCGHSIYQHLQNCENGLGTKCGHLIYKNVFESKTEVSKDCCSRLLTVGKDCHDLLTEVTIVYKRLTEKHAKEIWLKNDKVWEQCQTE